jgi:hypothetical protein
VLAAGLLFELGLRPFVEDSFHPGQPSIRTIRNYFEGLAVAHFEPDGLGQLGNRITGNPQLPGALEGLIVGDSHVVAYSVRDQDTMGAVVERLSRASGHQLNVHQYGWHGANAPTFVATADSLGRARKPVWVAVVLNSYNISINALTPSDGWRFEVAPDYSIRLIPTTKPRQMASPDKPLDWLRRSVLALALRHRLGLLQAKRAGERTSADTTLAEQDLRLAEEAARVPRATVLALKRAYGARLLIVYTPAVGDDGVEPVEMELRDFCAEQHVAFLSVRAALARDRYEHSRLSRGFHNTAPGVGHFNAIGHKIIGEEIWGYLRGDSPSSMPR